MDANAEQNIEIDRSIRSPNFHSDTNRRVRFIVIHQTMGNVNSDIAILTNDQVPLERRVSAHYLIDRDGKIYELVPPEYVAWHAGTLPQNQKPGDYRSLWGYGNENTHSIGIEHTAYENQPLTEAQKTSSVRLVSHLVNLYPAILPDRLHIVGHYELSKIKIDPQVSVPGVPLNWDWDGFISAVQSATSHEKLPQLEPLPTGGRDFGRSDYFPQTGQYSAGGFKTLWRKAGNGLFLCGFPLTTEEDENGLTVQYYENVRMEWRPGIQPRFGAVGRMYVQLAAISQAPDSRSPSSSDLFFPQTNQSVRGSFRELFTRYGVPTCGYPITAELQEDSLTVQYFENVRMERGSNLPARFGAVGRQYLTAIHTEAGL
jgi:N-acetyl-anhydromuramyl-L-alanine amidase AmpD